MIELLIGNSESQLTNLPLDLYQELRGILSYTPNPNASFYSGGFGSKRKYLLTKTGIFPSGLLEKVVLFLEDSKVTYKIVDTRAIPQSTVGMFKLKGFE